MTENKRTENDPKAGTFSTDHFRGNCARRTTVGSLVKGDKSGCQSQPCTRGGGGGRPYNHAVDTQGCAHNRPDGLSLPLPLLPD